MKKTESGPAAPMPTGLSRRTVLKGTAAAAGAAIGSGAITPLDGSEAESLLQTVFILPEYQGQGVGRALLQALEADHYFLRARRVVANASITARPFYEKMGYAYPSGRPVLIDNDYYEMEKLKAEGQA